MRRLTLSLAVAVGLVALQAVNAFACLEWCGEDPPVTFTTPAGQSVTVNVTDYVFGSQHIRSLAKARFHTYVYSAGDGSGTYVVLRDTIPTLGPEEFPVKAEVAYQGAILARASGDSGQPMTLVFFVPVR